MTQTNHHAPDIPQPKIHTAAYIIAALSFIPLLGIPFGLLALIWSIIVWRKQGAKTVALIAALGICLTVALYSSLFYFGFKQRGGVYDELRQELAANTLATLVSEIEFYRLQHGVYPESLEQLQQSQPGKPIFLYDPSDTLFDTLRPFYYERSGSDHYYLRSLGNDNQPFTDDDILPRIEPTEESKIGLLLQKETQQQP